MRHGTHIIGISGMCADIPGINVILSGISDYRISLIQIFNHATSTLVGSVVLIIQVSIYTRPGTQSIMEKGVIIWGYRIWITATCLRVLGGEYFTREKLRQMEIIF